VMRRSMHGYQGLDDRGGWSSEVPGST
jgi:hypothetical protein